MTRTLLLLLSLSVTLISGENVKCYKNCFELVLGDDTVSTIGTDLLSWLSPNRTLQSKPEYYQLLLDGACSAFNGAKPCIRSCSESNSSPLKTAIDQMLGIGFNICDLNLDLQNNIPCTLDNVMTLRSNCPSMNSATNTVMNLLTKPNIQTIKRDIDEICSNMNATLGCISATTTNSCQQANLDGLVQAIANQAYSAMKSLIIALPDSLRKAFLPESCLNI